jgi:glycosyltransferase involved in cell wall biosynthesis
VKILLQVPLNPYSGYGQDGIGMARAFMKLGADVHIAPVTVQPPLTADIASLLMKEAEEPFDLFIHHVDPNMLDAESGSARASTVKVGWTMWEYTSFDNIRKLDTLKKRLKNFDALVAYDRPTYQCFEPYVREGQALFKLQGGVDYTGWEEVERDWTSDRFGFCMNGALSLRKDPFVAIEAFRQLKDEHAEEFEPAELHLKNSIMSLHPGLEDLIPKLRVHYGVWPVDVLKDFYAKQHVLLAPSRGEGKNVPALEFQAMGGAVIATDWGGHKEWIHPDFAYPLDYELRPVDLEFPNSLNARASVDHLKELMLHAFRNRAEVEHKGHLAAQTLPQMTSWDAVVERLLLKLKATVPGGPELYDKAKACERQDD